MAAEIVEVRVGRHPAFTRVVFELDRAAGYRIERSDPASETAELVVSLEAASTPRSITAPKKSLIEQVEVESQGSRSIARVRLAKDGLRLKEMILANPPRIVVDVLGDAPSLAERAPTPKASKPKPAARPTPEPDPKPAPNTVAETAPTPPQPEPAPVEPAPPAADRKPLFAADPAPAPEPEALFESDPADDVQLAEAAPGTGASDEPSTAVPVAPMPGEEMPGGDMPGEAMDGQGLTGAATGDEPGTEVAFDDPAAEPAATPSAPAPIEPMARPEKPAKPRPMVARTKPAADEGGGFMTWALIGVGAVVLLAGGFFVARRRGGDAEDEDAFGEPGVGEQDDAPVSASDANPFSGLDGDTEQMAVGDPDATTVSPMMDDEETTVMSLPEDEEKEAETVVFGGSQENDMDDMEVISRDQVNESLGGAMPPVAAGIPEEFQQMMMQMKQKVEALESRVDELVDARDRLERQVAAQTEELRVQRAAIARTQRAVRNLGRPEGEEEQEATEPALRDPNQ